MPTIAKHPVTGVINVILGEGESLSDQFNSEKVVVYRRDSTTDWTIKVVKPLGLLASPEALKVNAKQRCSGDSAAFNGDPIHQHDDGSWWHFDELWSLENGPFETWDDAYNALAEYCTGLEQAQKTAQEMAEEFGKDPKDYTDEAIVKKLIKKLFPNGVPNEQDDAEK